GAGVALNPTLEQEFATENYVDTVGTAGALLNSTNTWTATQMYVSSIAVSAPGGVGVTYGAVLGSATINNLTNNQYVKTNGSNQLVSVSIQATDIPGGATSYIQLTGALQAGSTFYVSSGTVNNLNIQSGLQLAGSAGNSTNILQSNGAGFAPSWVAAPASPSSLLSTTNTWTATQMYVSSIAVSASGGVGVTYGVVAGSFTGNGSGLTNLTGANIVTGIPATVLPSSVAYLSVNQLWTAPQTYGSSVTITSPSGQLVSFNLTAGSMTVNNLNASQFVKTDGSKNLVSSTIQGSDLAGAAILNQNSLQAGATAYPDFVYVGTSETVKGSGGLGVTYGAILGSATVNNLTNNQFVKTNGSNQLVSATIQASDIPGGATSYIQLTSALQSGATFYVSSGTVNNLNIQSTLQ